jgi:hypothetical protein
MFERWYIFIPKIAYLRIFRKAWWWKILFYFRAIWYLYWYFWIFYGRWVFMWQFWFVVTRKIRQPCSVIRLWARNKSGKKCSLDFEKSEIVKLCRGLSLVLQTSVTEKLKRFFSIEANFYATYFDCNSHFFVRVLYYSQNTYIKIF